MIKTQSPAIALALAELFRLAPVRPALNPVRPPLTPAQVRAIVATRPR